MVMPVETSACDIRLLGIEILDGSRLRRADQVYLSRDDRGDVPESTIPLSGRLPANPMGCETWVAAA
jgi:hypothetical protein